MKRVLNKMLKDSYQVVVMLNDSLRFAAQANCINNHIGSSCLASLREDIEYEEGQDRCARREVR